MYYVPPQILGHGPPTSQTVPEPVPVLMKNSNMKYL